MANPQLDKDDIRQLLGTVSLNDAVKTAELNNEFLLVPQNVSQLRDVIVADGSRVRPSSADVSFSKGTYTITTQGSNSYDRQSFESARVGRYRPGSVFVAGIYVRKSSAPEGKFEFGYFRNSKNDGIFLRYKSDGTWEVVIAFDGTETTVPQKKWGNSSETDITDSNSDVVGTWYGLDRMDGSGGGDNPSGLDISNWISDGGIAHFVGSWYGGGGLAPALLTTGKNGSYSPNPVGVFRPKNQVSFTQPNQPVTARLDNDGSTTSDSAEVAGRQYSIFGNSEDKQRVNSDLHTSVSVGTSYEPIYAFRRKTGFKGVPIGPQRLGIYTDQRLHLYAEVNADIDSANTTWSDPSAVNQSDEAAIETAIKSNLTIGTADQGTSYGGVLFGSGKNDRVLDRGAQFDFPVPREDAIVLHAKSVTGSAATIDLNFIGEESW